MKIHLLPCLAWPLFALAGEDPPTSPPAPVATTPKAAWQAANDEVRAFPRGHIDLLKWEGRHLPHAARSPKAQGAARGLDQWLLDAMLARVDLHAEAGMSAAEREQVRLRRAELAWQVRGAWLDAVLARATLALQGDSAEASQLALTLAQRMQQVGNWSEQRVLEQSAQQQAAERALAQAELQAQRTLEDLWRLLGDPATGPEALASALPAALPEVPAVPAEPAPLGAARLANPDWLTLSVRSTRLTQAVDPQGLAHWEMARQASESALLGQPAQRGAVAAPTLNRTLVGVSEAQEEALHAQTALTRLSRQIDSRERLALALRAHAHRLARSSQAQGLPTAEALHEQMQLHYNGMLASVWDLLDSARRLNAAGLADAQARHAYWRAQFQLEAIQSGLPLEPAMSASAAPESQPTGGH